MIAELEASHAQLDEMLKGASGDSGIAIFRAMVAVEEKLAALRAK